jgi:hypothetical protein
VRALVASAAASEASSTTTSSAAERGAADPSPPPQAARTQVATSAAAACRAARIAAVQGVFIALVSMHARVGPGDMPRLPAFGAMLLKSNYITKSVLSLNWLCNYIAV